MSKRKPTNFKQQKAIFATFTQKTTFIQTVAANKKMSAGIIARILGAIRHKRNAAVRKII